METRALNVCRSGPLPEYAEDSEETPVQTGEIEYEQGDQLFMTQVLPEPTAEELRAASTTSQKLAEGACRSVEAQREPFIPPNCIRGFESVFAKEDFDILPEHRQWDHAIELILGLEPKSSKVYPLNRRQARWSLHLARFDFLLHHCPGRTMGKPDALSRRADHRNGASDNENVVLLRPEFLAVCALEGVELTDVEQKILSNIHKGNQNGDQEEPIAKAA